jgi:hypothetical protein
MPRVAKEKILDQISINGGLRVLDNPLPLKTVATHGTDELEDLQCPFIE